MSGSHHTEEQRALDCTELRRGRQPGSSRCRITEIQMEDGGDVVTGAEVGGGEKLIRRDGVMADRCWNVGAHFNADSCTC